MRLHLPRRPLGRTGFLASRLGQGDVADRSVPLHECAAVVVRALDLGLNVVDTAPNYEDGYSEQILRVALAARREQVFLIDKIDQLHEPVAQQVAGSLSRLGCASVDLLAFHACSTMRDLDALLQPGGGFEQAQRERDRGRVRFLGLSSHDPAVLLAAIDAGVCDVLMFPIGPFVDRRYEEQVLPRCRERGIGQVCFKTFGAGKLLGDTLGYQRPLPGALTAAASAAAPPKLPRLSVEECVRYTLTVDPDVALLGLSSASEQDAALLAARDFVPMSSAELAAVRERAAAAVQGKGDCWWNPQ